MSAVISRPSTRRSCRASSRTMRPPQKASAHGWRKSSRPPRTSWADASSRSFNYNSVYLFSKTPINKLDDLKGMKVRTFSVGLVDYISALGGEPVSMPVSDLYTGLERGTIQAAVTGPDQVEGQRLYEVCKYMTDLQLGSSPAYTVVSRKSWDRLPADLKKVIDDIAPTFTETGWEAGRDQQQGRHRAGQGQGHDGADRGERGMASSRSRRSPRTSSRRSGPSVSATRSRRTSTTFSGRSPASPSERNARGRTVQP